MLPSISKVFEKAIYSQLFQYLTVNSLLHGFRAKYSTELALNEMVDRIHSQLDENKIPIAIFMDLSKAFDTIDHEILITKMEHYGITNLESQWFKSYLSEDTPTRHSREAARRTSRHREDSPACSYVCLLEWKQWRHRRDDQQMRHMSKKCNMHRDRSHFCSIKSQRDHGRTLAPTYLR